MAFSGIQSSRLRLGAFAAGFFLLAALAAAQASTFRIVVLDGQTLEAAQRLQSILKDFSYSPVIVDRDENGYRVLYGAFPTRPTANRELGRIDREGVHAKGVIQLDEISAPQGPAGPVTAYAVLVREFTDQEEANQFVARLQADAAKYEPIRIQQVGRYFRVYVGNHSQSDATLLFGQLRQGGYTVDNVSKVDLSPESMSRPAAGATPAPVRPAVVVPGTAALPPAITSTETWKGLTLDEQREVIAQAAIRSAPSSGGDAAVVQSVFDLEKRLNSLSENVRDLVERIDQEKKTERALAEAVEQAMTQAENYIRSRDYDQARIEFNKALDLDKDDVLGRRHIITARIGAVDLARNKIGYIGEDEDLKAKIKSLTDEIEMLGRSNNMSGLQRRINLWDSIRVLDPSYGETAANSINELNAAMQKIEQEGMAGGQEQNKKTLTMIYGLGGAIGVLLLLMLLSWRGSRKKHKELISRLHDITSSSIRPMRGLEGTNAPLLETGGGTESDLFSPRAPLPGGGGSSAVSEDILSDPLGGLSDMPTSKLKVDDKKAKKGKDKKGKAEPEPTAPIAEDDFDALFGGGSKPAQPAKPKAVGGDDMGLDDIFGGSEPSKGPASQTTGIHEAEVTKQAAMDDDIFGGLFGGSSSAPVPPKPGPATQKKEDTHDHPMISFEGFGEPQEAAPATAVEATTRMPVDNNDDLLAIFGDVAGGTPESSNGMAGETTQGLSNARAGNDDDEISSVKLDLPGVDTAVSFGMPDPNERTNPKESTVPGSGSFGGSSSNGATGIEQDFENENVGARPAGWEGEYAFASLTVKSETPPRGSQQYLCFEKHDGSGKALFSRRFADVSGRVAIEFDLRCNDKNKFLLGIYVEKDGDFQQAVHTKILRSEAQTTPTIHMQGESAPYLLGSWAHLKYIVDMNRGTLNSYIDNTHVGRDVALEPNPGVLNTLSIRDNINTTGVLLLDNIRIYSIE